MSYIVVFQYKEALGGLYGNRLYKEYKNKRHFESDSHLNLEVITTNVTGTHAEKLVALTPEICLYMFAVESFFTNLKKPNALELDKLILGYKNHIIATNRKIIVSENLERIDAMPYIQHYKQMVEKSPTTPKSFAIMWALSMVDSEKTGQVR